MVHRPTNKLGAYTQHQTVIFRVWAPFAKDVALLIDDNGEHKTIPMARDGDDWQCETADVKPGQNYHYLVTSADGQQVERNDPRARRLTSSNNGWSVVVEDDFDWSDDTFTATPLKNQVIYELHVGTFNRPDASTPGTFTTVIDKLPYLKNLGVTAIELMPVTSMMDDTGWGYAPTHLFSIEESYGGRHGLMNLVKAAHQQGLAVIIDVVYNHLAPKNELWQFDGWSENGHGGIYFYNDERGNTPWGARPDYGRTEVRQFLLDTIEMWLLEFHVDGLRFDATYYIDKLRDNDGRELRDIPDGYSLLSDITHLAHSIKPNSYMIAEDAGYSDNASSPSGLGFDAQWDTSFPRVLRTAMGVASAQNLDIFIGELQRYYNGQAFQKIIYSDSHDSAANGHERLNEEAAKGGENELAREKTLIASAITFTAPGVPMLLQGEEFVESGYFTGWRALDWDHQAAYAGIVTAHTDLARLRRSLGGLNDNGMQLFHVNYGDGIIGFARWSDNNQGDTLTMINFNDKSFDHYEIMVPKAGVWQLVFNSCANTYSPDFPDSAPTPSDTITVGSDGKAVIKLHRYQALIFTRLN